MQQMSGLFPVRSKQIKTAIENNGQTVEGVEKMVENEGGVAINEASQWSSTS